MKTILYFSVIMLVFSAAACREELPVREDVSDLVTITMRSRYETIQHSNASGSVRLFVTMVNRTDETLEDIARLTGKFEIVWQVQKDNAPRVDLARTIKFSPSDLFYAKQFDRQTKKLTLDPKDSIVLSVIWNLKTNDSTYLMNYFPWTEDQTECYVSLDPYPGPVLRRITLPQRFNIKANVLLFDRMSILFTKTMEIKHCIMGGHRGEVQGPPYKPCTDFTHFDPCASISQ